MHKKTPHPDFLDAKQYAYLASGLHITDEEPEAESQDYGALTFSLGALRVKFRVGKITPTKTGQFVTIWKRNKEGITAPYDVEDPVDLFVISVRDHEHFGQFVFPKTVLHQKGYIGSQKKGGKRAMRIYPPWDKALNKQAQTTKAWQLAYFFSIKKATPVDVALVRRLFLV
jgi:hypothetical protein